MFNEHLGYKLYFFNKKISSYSLIVTEMNIQKEKISILTNNYEQMHREGDFNFKSQCTQTYSYN
jgi:hypothetical protein